MKDDLERAADATYENEIMQKAKETDDFVLLIEQHKKDIWEWKQKESQWIRDKNQLDGNKRIIEELSTRLVEMGKTIIDLKKRAQEAEGETTIVKGIGMNSPEMRAAQAKIKELESTLASAQDINDNHQRYNGKLQTRLTEVEGDNKRLAQQVNDYREQLRKAGF